MPTFRFNKLIRDKIIEQMTNDGARFKTRQLSDEEYKTELARKVAEEAGELLSSNQDIPNDEGILEEIADVQEAIDNLITAHGTTKKHIAMLAQRKNEKYGSFKNRVFVEEVEVPEGYYRIEHFRRNAERYPEL